MEVEQEVAHARLREALGRALGPAAWPPDRPLPADVIVQAESTILALSSVLRYSPQLLVELGWTAVEMPIPDDALARCVRMFVPPTQRGEI